MVSQVCPFSSKFHSFAGHTFKDLTVFGEEFVELVLTWPASPDNDIPDDFLLYLLSLNGDLIDRTCGEPLPCYDDLRGKSHVAFKLGS
jgi:hypothetical protein